MRILRRLLALTLAALLASLLAPADAHARPSDYPGMASYPTYNSRFYDGPPIGHLAGYVPQGIAYWKAKDALVLSYYDEDYAGSPALLSVRNRLGKKNERKWIKIVGGHAGGVVIGTKYLWVASTDVNDNPYVYRYSLKRLAKAKHRSYLTRYDKRFPVAASSYVTLRGGDLWVGQHTTGLDRHHVPLRHQQEGQSEQEVQEPDDHAEQGAGCGVQRQLRDLQPLVGTDQGEHDHRDEPEASTVERASALPR